VEVGEVGCWIELAHIDAYLIDGMCSVDEEGNAFFLEKLL
jgi:hypothetical protein